MEINPLTGLYYNFTFWKKAEEYIQNAESDTYMMVAIDIEHFRLFNKLYGREEGDKLLSNIADCLKGFQQKYGGVVGYLGGDNYGVLMPKRRELLRQLRREVEKEVRRWSSTAGFLPAFGIYPIDDITISAAIMYDRATTALTHVIGNYAKRICEYSPDMEEKLEEELMILSDVQEGLEKEEFTFYIQPQVEISTGRIVGGEALVRWKHGTKGLISPGVFVPLLEKNGFIADLDRYLWKRVCKWLRDWTDRGYQPVPVSVNVSRIDILSMNVPAYLKDLVNAYGLSPELLKVEITESAYAEDDEKVANVVTELRESGFPVMMDDFGSGYSSLNMLKSVTVDALKIDMHFLEMEEQEEEKGVGILESVVNMARQLKVPVIIEGVETQKQENVLLKMGCRYSQGFYYYKPLPVEEFEKIILDERNVDFDGIWCRQIEQMHVREFLDTNLFNDIMVNNILGPAAFYEMYENQIEITRVNEPYYELSGIRIGVGAENKRKLGNHVRDDDRQKLFALFEEAYENPYAGAEDYLHFIRVDGQVLRVYMRIFFLREKEGRKVFYGSIMDLAYARKKDKEEISSFMAEELTEKQKAQMEKYYGHLPCGYGVFQLILDMEGKPYDYEIVYANGELLKDMGGDIRRLQQLALRAFANDKDDMFLKAYYAAYKGEIIDHYSYSNMSNRYLQFTLCQYERGYVGCMVRDITHMYIYENAFDSVAHTYREVYFLNLQDNHCRMVYPDEQSLIERGNYEEVVNRHFGMGKVLHYDEENVRKFLSLENIRKVLQNQNTAEYKYRRSINGKGEEWCLTSVSVSEREEGVPKTAIITIRSIESLMREKAEQKRQNMATTLANMSDGFFIYRAVGDEEILYANPIVLKIYGCDTMEEFRSLVKNSFQGMVHPEDLNRVEYEIKEQIQYSERRMDYIRYRIIRKDGEIRWIDDIGHLEHTESGEDAQLFYVFISDITETITEQQKTKLLSLNQHYV